MNRDEAPNDEELIEQVKRGRTEAFDRLLHRHAKDVAAVLEGMVRDHHLALDLTQEVFLKLYRILPRYVASGKFRSMLFAMTLNHGRDALRKKRRSKLIFFEERQVQEPALAADTTHRSDDRALIQACLEHVPEPFREALSLCDLSGLSYEEIAATLACSLGTAKSRVHRGRLHFRDAYRRLVQDIPSRSGEDDATHESS